MIKKIGILCLFLATLIANTGGSAERLPSLDFSLPVPESETARIYLGVKSGDRFTLEKIQADVLIIQIFSMYCPICQREAGDVNAMYDMIQADPKLSKQVKFIGIGAGNSDFEVKFYQDNYSVNFPLFSDGNYIIHKQINEVRTPHFFGLKMKPDNTFDIFYSQSGEIEDPKAFLDLLIQRSGME